MKGKVLSPGVCKVYVTNSQYSATWKEFNRSGSDYSSSVKGLEAYAEKCIACRGILADYKDCATRNGIIYEETKTHQITVEAVKALLIEANTKIMTGDILFIRTGFVRGYLDLDPSQQDAKKMERQ